LTTEERDAIQSFVGKLRELRDCQFGEVQATVKKTGGVLSFGEFGLTENKKYR